MKKHKPYSVTRLISGFMLLLFSTTVILSLFYYTAFSQKAYSENLESARQETQRAAQEASAQIALNQQLLAWIVSEVTNAAYWSTERASEQILFRQTVENSLQGMLYNSDSIDAAFLVRRSDSVVIARHRLLEREFLALLRENGPNQVVKPTTPRLFWNEAGVPSHLILEKAVVVQSTQTQVIQSAATIYIAIRLDDLLTSQTQRGICGLYYGTERQLTLCSNGADSLPEKITLEAPEQNTVSLSGGKHTVLLESTEFPGLYVVNLVPQQYLSNRLMPVISLGIGLVLVIFLLTIMGIRAINALIHQPVQEIVEGVRKIQRGEYTYRLEPTPARELHEISTGINNVLDELGRRTQKQIAAQENLYRQQLLYQQSRLLALQSQINPHFLYNTLECVRSIAQSRNVPEIKQIISGMIRIFRYGASEDLMGTVKSELTSCADYLQIMQVRYGDRFCFQINADAETESIAVPRLVLQPLAENAINHGFADKLSGGIVTIECRIRDGELLMLVRDNGKGIPEETLQELLAGKYRGESGSIGLKNVQQRLQYRGGRLSIESKAGAYTVMTAHIPLSQTEQEVPQ